MCFMRDGGIVVIVGRTLQIRDVPDDVHATLRSRAAAAGLSLSDYALRALAEVAARPAVSDVLKWASERSGGASTADIVAAVRRERDARG
jgi:plasmid stability protein